MLQEIILRFAFTLLGQILRGEGTRKNIFYVRLTLAITLGFFLNALSLLKALKLKFS